MNIFSFGGCLPVVSDCVVVNNVKFIFLPNDAFRKHKAKLGECPVRIQCPMCENWFTMRNFREALKKYGIKSEIIDRYTIFIEGDISEEHFTSALAKIIPDG